jgi:hypothetical protein
VWWKRRRENKALALCCEEIEGAWRPWTCPMRRGVFVLSVLKQG